MGLILDSSVVIASERRGDTVEQLIERIVKVERGQTLDEFLDDFPTVTREAASDALEHAKEFL